MQKPPPVLPLVLLLTLGAAGCGSDDSRPAAPPMSSPSASGETGPADDAIAIEGFKYLPEDVTVDAGTTVTWTNHDAAPHTATADDGSFDTGNLRKGDAGRVTLRETGSFTYFCEFHKFMRAKITVR